MIKNYFKIAWRNIIRQKIYTTINVLGLSLGITACLVIYLITHYEFSFDRFHPHGDRIYRIVGEVQRGSGEKDFLNSPVSDVAGFRDKIPGFEAACGFHLYGESVTIPQPGMPPKKFGGRIDGSWSAASIITGPQYFDIFQYQWLRGNAKAALSRPFQVVLSEKRARQYFGNIPLDQTLGKTVVYQDSLKVTVAGIVRDWDQHTDFGFTDFISISTATHSFLKNQIPTEDWSSLSPHRSMAFVKLAGGTTAAQVNQRFAAFIREHVKDWGDASKLTMMLQPLTAIHFSQDFHRGDDGDNFRKPYMPVLYVLMGVALFILIIAAINFINLSTAQSIQRAKEIGVRKVLGSRKKDIIFQFLAETAVITAFAASLSVFLVKPVLYLFHDYIPPGLNFSFSASTCVFLIVVTVTTTLLAGLYPAKILASYLPVLTLKGAASSGAEKLNLRKALIVFQFTISLIFIIGAIVIGNQIRFMRKADKGFNTDAVITLYQWGDHEGKLNILAGRIKHIAGIDQVIMQGTAPMGFARNIDKFKYSKKDETVMQITANMGNDEFIPFYKMKIIAGRNMLHSDSLNELVINEAFARKLGFKTPGDAVGITLNQVGYQTEKPYPVVGVVADFHQGSFHETIAPAVIENVPDRKQSIAIRLGADKTKTGDVKVILSQMQAEWKKIFPEIPFDYSFLNESITRLYGQEENTAWLVNVAMGMTIFISCLGLFGFGMFTARKRTKEIGIRKVLGASVASITALLSKDFLKLVILALLIASPIAWYFMNRWLEDFAYRTSINWWVFGLAGLSAMIIALFTVSFQAIKAARSNPVKSLRTE
ncbi:MAG: ABC transporter permease [Bacteroidota bacterium]|nr:ABC transporter permease [Bacteroidota bacterium]